MGTESKRLRKFGFTTNGLLLFWLSWFLSLPNSGMAAETSPPTDGELVAAVQSHKTRDSSPVGEVIGEAAWGIRSLGWWADRDKGEAGYAYSEFKSPQERQFVSWEVGADRTVTPLSEEAWIAELGRLPFAYFVNQRNFDIGDRRHVDRRLIGDPRVLAFLTTVDGNLEQIFAQRRLTLRRMIIQWITDPSAQATNGRLYYGYLVTIEIVCRGPEGQPLTQSVRYIEPRGHGNFERLDNGAQKSALSSEASCLP